MAIEGTFTALNQVSATFNPPTGYPRGTFNVTGRGTFVGTVQLERSFNQGADWDPLTLAGQPFLVWTAPFSETVGEDETGVEYRLRCTVFTSGVITYRLGGDN